MSARAYAKGVIESVLAGPPANALLRGRVRGRSIILAYHNIVADRASITGDRSLHMPLTDFAAQLDVVQRTCDIVPLTEILSSNTGRPRVAITFDDGYRGAVRLGFAELARRTLPSAMFVTPGRLDRQAFWWDVLASAQGLSEDAREHALTTLQGKDERVREWARAQRLGELNVPEDLRTATEMELRDAASAGLVQYGAHTWGHPSLPTLDRAELESELARPLAWLRERFSSAIPWLAYPYGHVSPAVHAATERAGYKGACLITGGWISDNTSALALPRQNVPVGLSLNGFRLRLMNLFCE